MTEQLRRRDDVEVKYGSMKGESVEVPTDFEEAIALAGTGKFHYVLLMVSGLCMMAVMFEIFSTSFLLPSAQCDFKFSSQEKGLLNSICIIGMISSSHMWGFLADTRGRRKILITALLMDSLATILSAFSHTFWLFLILRFFNGFFIVAPATVLYAYLGEFHAVQTRSKAILWVCIFIGVAIAVQPAMAWLVIPQTWAFELPWCTFNSWRIFVLLCAVPGLVSATSLILWFPESPKFLMVIDEKEEALRVLSNIYACNTGNSPQRFPVKSMELLEDGCNNPASNYGLSVKGILNHMWKQTVPLFVPPLLLKTLLVCSIQFGLYASANGLSLWLPDVFNHLAEYSYHHPESSGSICQAYAINTNGSAQENVNSNRAILSILSINDTVHFTCDVNEVILKVNNKTLPFSANTDIIQCQNGLLYRTNNSDALLFDMINGSATISLWKETTECNADVDFTVFQNTIILGIVSAIALFAVGHLIGPLSKKTILVCNLIIGGIAGFVMNYVFTMWEVLLVAGIFVTFSGMCISVLVSTVVEMFPTHLRAMAVCLSLMVGRLGSVFINMLMGTLLETECTAMIFIMGGICVSCGLLSTLLPSPKRI